MKFVNENIDLDQIPQAEPQEIDEIAQMYDSVMKNLNSQLRIPKDVMNSFQIRQELNPSFWNKYQLQPEIRIKLLKAAIEFFKSLKLPEHIKMKDVLFCGSLANYNWSKFSDVDLHIVVDFTQFEDEDFVQKYFDAEKNLWNMQHDISIEGYPVEMYVQDVNAQLDSSALYSVAKDKWLIKPERQGFKLDKQVIKQRVLRIFDKMRDIRRLYQRHDFEAVIKNINQLKDGIKKMRQAGLENGGEFSTENLVFKVLRRTDFMEILSTYRDKAYDRLLSLNQ